jgi:hypothetical protein
MLENILPASELPIWKAHFNDEPWGFDADDYLHSKNALFTSTTLRAGVTVHNLMEQDPYADLSLTPEQFDRLDEEEQLLYSKRLVERAKRANSNGQ